MTHQSVEYEMLFLNTSSCLMLLQNTPDRFLVDIPLHSLVPNGESITVVWFNPALWESKIDSSTMIHIRLLRHYVLVYTDQTLCVEYLTAKMNRCEHIILVIEGVEVFDEAYQCDQVKWIVSVRSDNRKNSIVREEKSSHCLKTVIVCEDKDSMVAELRRVIAKVEQQTSQQLDGAFKTLGKKERSLRDLQNQLGSSIWCLAFRSE